MLDRAQIIALVAGIAIVIGVIELMRRNKLREEYSLLWIALGFVVIALSASRGLLHWLAHITGIFYPPSAFFGAALLGCLALFMHFSVVISRLTDQVVSLAQEMALMRMEESGGHARLRVDSEGQGS